MPDPDAPLMLSVSGCRGIFGASMTPEVAARYAMVLGGYFREHAPPVGAGTRPRVILARDGRAGGVILARAAAAGLAASGCDVTDLGVAMTPTVGVMADQTQAAGGLVITASHNPQEWNGLKPITRDTRTPGVAASAPNKTLAATLIERYKAAAASGARGVDLDHAGDIAPAASGAALGLPGEGTFAHVEKVRDALKAIGSVEDRRAMGISCIVDSVNASGVDGAKALLGTRLKHHLGSSDNGIFPHPPEPTRDNLAGLAKFVADKRADIGFAQDPDADRLAIIDEKGVYIGEEYTLALAARAVLEADPVRSKNAVLCVNLSTSRMIEDVAAAWGGGARVLRTAVGEANVVEAMKAHHSPIGGEGNGGIIWPRVTYIRDSLGAMGLVLAVMARTGKKLSELVADIPAYAIVKRKADLSSAPQAARAVEQVAKAFAKEQTDRQDGVWVGLPRDRAWLHVRASNTEPIIRLIAEAPTAQMANQLLDRAADAIAKS